MNEIDWSQAPEWAKTVIRSGGNDGRLFWAEAFGTVSRRQRISGYKDSDANGADMTIKGHMWTLVETRPGAWTGEGLPPVGVVCEAAIPHTSGPNNERSFIWIEGSVIAYYEIKGKTYAWFSEVDGFYPPAVLEFRPILTPEQIAADERDKAAHELFRSAWPETHSWGDLSPHWQEAFYRLADAGYRKP